MPVARLLREHAKLRTLGAELVVLVSGSVPCDLAILGTKRWELARTVHQHLAYEDRQLFQRLVDDPSAQVRIAARTARDSIERLHSLYKSHIEQWTAADVHERWPQFQAAVRTMVMRMTLKLDFEELALFPLIVDRAELPPRWQAGARNWAGDAMAMQPLISAVARKHENVAAPLVTIPSFGHAR